MHWCTHFGLDACSIQPFQITPVCMYILHKSSIDLPQNKNNILLQAHANVLRELVFLSQAIAWSNEWMVFKGTYSRIC